MSQASEASPSLRIKQKRSQRTYEALIRTGFKLLETREFEAITIAELSQTAGYSVGAFYARFQSKDEFLEAMISHHLEERTHTREHLLATVSNEKLISVLIEDLVGYYWKRRRFWRAALIRTVRDPAFWEPIRRHGHEFANAFLARMSEHSGRALTKTEDRNVRFAFQLALGTINNTIMNRPGPVFMGQKQFIDDLARAFRLVSDYDRLMGLGSTKRKSAR